MVLFDVLSENKFRELKCDQLFTVVDLVLIMSVNPGFGGQSFIESQVKKISDLRRLCAEKVWFNILVASIFSLLHEFLLYFFFPGSESMD